MDRISSSDASDRELLITWPNRLSFLTHDKGFEGAKKRAAEAEGEKRTKKKTDKERGKERGGVFLVAKAKGLECTPQ